MLKQKCSLCLHYPVFLILRKYKVYYTYGDFHCCHGGKLPHKTSVDWNALILFQISESSLSQFQLFSCWQFCGDVFFVFPYYCSRTNPELVLMQKSLNAVKLYTRQIKSHSKNHPEVFVSQMSADLQRRRRLVLLGTTWKPQGLKATQKNFLLEE